MAWQNLLTSGYRRLDFPWPCMLHLTPVRFLLSLPRKTATIFVASGLTFISGAIGLEMLGGMLAESQGIENLAYLSTSFFEELLEMLGIIGFIYGLLQYINLIDSPEIEAIPYEV